MKKALLIVLAVSLFLSYTNPDKKLKKGAVLSLNHKKKHPLNDNVFGHFLEKCNWSGETGADVIWDDETGTIRKDVEVFIDSLEVPIVRFPGGTDIDYYQWTELIDNAYDRKDPERPHYDGRSDVVVSDNSLGIDEFLQLAERRKFEPLLVVNLGDAYFEKRSLKESAEYAAALVAYCNLSVEADAPEKYLKWAKLREKNGRKEPYNVTYFQIGNEVWFFDKKIDLGVLPIEDKVLDRYYNLVESYIDEMRGIDSSIKIIIEGNSVGLVKPAKEKLGDKFDMMAYHHYKPWGLGFAIDEAKDTIKEITPEALYYGMITVPDFNPTTGQSDFHSSGFKTLVENEVDIAVTEWNWNGWVTGPFRKAGLKDSKLAQAIGSTSMLHAMMRHSKYVKIGNQSMMAGNSWGINTIRIEKKTGKGRIFPTGLATGLYAKHHGNEFVESSLSNQEFYEQPYHGIGILNPEPKVAYLDVVVSESDQQFFIHVINRDYSSTRNIHLDAASFNVKDNFKHMEISGEVYAKKNPLDAVLTNTVNAKEFLEENRTLQVNPHSINVFVLDKN
ncbi:hypothetical protein Q4566_07255 [Tamlana sp. 2_MG-2023]|uniref:hypothetical protein n=1 Tax=unclassified Tamlana TaxID=2614803 RepID=UPI0026E2CFA4|nr:MULTISPECIES: hypothetical protein [unclassified Tamlana]MDO6759994.1 hypothetical protein [Tamlana sp. 2_MG-2023]MDO6791836.1 hypothetical protein [Tamlana sp. 1_MG-2023]